MLSALLRRASCSQALALRVRIILGAGADQRNEPLARQVGCTPKTVHKWRGRWLAAITRLSLADDEPAALAQAIAAVLADAPRSGAPGTFTAWTPRESAAEATRQGIVGTISPRSVGRFLNGRRFAVDRSRSWLNAKTKHADPDTFAAQVERLCTAYAYAPMLEALGCQVVSTDEMTGIQTLGRAAPTKPMRPCCPERREHEYIRQSTLNLSATFNVATEADFAAHIAQVTDTDPDAPWLFLADNRNTHQSEALVWLVATRCVLPDDLGVKGRAGILRSMPSRAAFLSAPAHRLQFLYTPTHTSWLNQIELWFSILARRILNRGDFASTDALRARILAFITDFNRDRHPLQVDLRGATALPLNRHTLPRLRTSMRRSEAGTPEPTACCIPVEYSVHLRSV